MVSATATGLHARMFPTFAVGVSVTWIPVFAFAFVDFCGYGRAVNCRWKLRSSSIRWTARALVRSASSARASLEIAFFVGRRSVPSMVSKRVHHAAATRALSVKASMQCLSYIT